MWATPWALSPTTWRRTGTLRQMWLSKPSCATSRGAHSPATAASWQPAPLRRLELLPDCKRGPGSARAFEPQKSWRCTADLAASLSKPISGGIRTFAPRLATTLTLTALSRIETWSQEDLKSLIAEHTCPGETHTCPDYNTFSHYLHYNPGVDGFTAKVWQLRHFAAPQHE